MSDVPWVADEIQRAMQSVRSSLGSDVQKLAQQVRETTDWRHHFRRHPWISLSAAAAAGYFLVPRRKTEVAGVQINSGPNLAEAKTVAGAAGGLGAVVLGLFVRSATNALVQQGLNFLKQRKPVDQHSSEARPTHVPGENEARSW